MLLVPQIDLPKEVVLCERNDKQNYSLQYFSFTPEYVGKE